jgi:hypothetical protein
MKIKLFFDWIARKFRRPPALCPTCMHPRERHSPDAGCFQLMHDGQTFTYCLCDWDGETQ